MKKNAFILLVPFLLLVSGPGRASTEASGAGASFPAPVYKNWAKSFEASQKITIHYDSVGSGEGVRRISSRSVDFGASDSALSNEELRKLGLIQIPTLIGGIVPVVNLPGVGGLRLTGDVLARIYLGRIGAWDHPDIRALNPGLSLPRLPILRVVRSDNSGSTKSFTAYLSSASSQWAAAVGAQGLPKWPAEVIAAKGSEGVRDAVSRTPGTLGYIGYNYVVKDRLNGVLLRNRSGRFVGAGEMAFAEAVNASGMRDSVSGPVSLIDREGAGTWPITETTYVLFERQPRDRERAKLALKFFFWAFQQGDEMARNTGFIPLPTQIQSRAVRLFSEVRDGSGSALNFF